MTPEREADIRVYIERHRHKVGARKPLGFSTALGAAADLLAALDEARREHAEATAADLAAAHDARVRAEALRDDRLAMELGEALMARMSELRFRPATVEQWAGVAADALEAVCLAEAERIGGGR